MTDIPRIIEGVNPFPELSPNDFVSDEEIPEQKQQRNELISEINAEFSRLETDPQTRNYITFQQCGTEDLNEPPIFNLMLFRDWLRRLEQIQIEWD